MRSEINYREKNVKNTNTWRLNNTLLNNQEISEEIKSFTDKQKLREFSTTKPALQQVLKELLQVGNTREEKDLQNQTQNN